MIGKNIELIKMIDDCTIIETYSFPNTVDGLKEAIKKFKDITKDILHTEIIPDDIVNKFLHEGKIVFNTVKITLIGDDGEIVI